MSPRYLLDTNIVSHIMQGRDADLLARLVQVPVGQVVISSVTLAELEYGLHRKGHPERLKNAMEQANMSQSALSEQAGASKAAISQYLSGKNTPGPDRIKALADATGVSFDYLMGYGAAPVAEPPIKKISVKEAARCMGKSDQFVRIGLQRGLLPFGNAVPGTGACWNYYINPTKFRDYVGADQFNSFFGLTA